MISLPQNLLHHFLGLLQKDTKHVEYRSLVIHETLARNMMKIFTHLDFVWLSDNAQGFVNVGSLRGILDQDHLHPCTLLEIKQIKHSGYMHLHIIQYAALFK